MDLRSVVVGLLLPGLSIQLLLMAGSGFFSGSETALFYLSRDELRAMQGGRPREQLVARLLRDPDRLLTVVLFWNLLINLTYMATSVVLARQLMDAGHPKLAWAMSLGGLAALILFGEVVPKCLAVVLHRPLAVAVSRPLMLAVRVLDPLLPVLGRTSRILRRGFWPHIRREPFLLVDDLERALEISGLTEQTIRQEQQILRRILDLSEMTAEEIMRPRSSYTLYRPPVSLAQLQEQGRVGDSVLLADEAVPVSDRVSIDRVIPLRSLTHLPAEHLEQLSEPVVHVPWCARLATVLERLRSQLRSTAAVVNEYGETIGVVTYDDLIDTILGESPSRTRRVLRREPMLEVAPGRYHVDGMTTLRFLSERLGTEYEPTADGLLTVAGMLHEEFERLPLPGDECAWNGWTFRVIEVARRGRVRVMVFR